ncbi:hypothetical protein [Herbaspirillum rubrisubalbicans]|uniref:hypothetical protein n=1 Tax=Herbaspirillum rubrisubalbicans TaxID=80842 RepID=UPI0012FE1466|nr:hypothetical protein [Herbaspirillum rubrisubalbicans]
MRPLTAREIERVSGADSVEWSLPGNITIQSTLEANQSTTLRFSYAGSSTPFYTWNSGQAVACYTIAGGFGLAAGILTANPAIGTLTSVIAGYGCNKIAESITPPDQGNSGSDGD